MRRDRPISRSIALALLALLVVAIVPGARADEPPSDLQPPQLEELIPARVPEGTRFPADEVRVVLELQVDTLGRVTDARVAESAGSPFDEAALQAARRFRFRPARLGNGEAVPVAIQFTLGIRRPARPSAGQPVAPRALPGAAARPVDFSGQLLERGTRKPLTGVEVRALARGGEPLASTVTDQDGRFRLVVGEARFELRAQAADHQALQLEVEARPGEQREERFYLETISTGFETLIESDRVKREVSRQVLPKELVERVPGTANDTLKVVQVLPGVARAAFDSGLIVLRGSSPGDSVVLLEGQKLPLLFHFGGLRSSVGSYFLDSVTFVPGNFSADHGRAMGGVIDVRLRDPARDTLHGQLDVNLYDAGVALEGPLSRSWSVGGAFRRSYVDSILPAVLPDDASLSFDTAPRFYDYQLLASWNPSPRRRLRLIAYGAMDKVVVLFDRPQSDPVIRGAVEARVLFHSFLASYTERFSDRLSQESSLQIGHEQLKTQLGPELFFNLDVTSFSFRTAWAYEHSSRFAARAGLDLVLDRASIAVNSPLRPIEGEDLSPTGTRSFFAADTVEYLYTPALFLEGTLRPNERFTVIGSLRLDWYRAIRTFTLDPRLTLRYEVSPSTVIKAALGSYQQPPPRTRRPSSPATLT